MKKMTVLAVLLLVSMLFACTAHSAPGAKGGRTGMTVESPGISSGYIDPAYGIHGADIVGGVPVLSLPLRIRNAPKGTVSFAVFMDDPDSVPVVGYRFVHWMAVNIHMPTLHAGFSANADGNAVQGENSFGKTGYGGPDPPDKDHTYVISVYALDADLDLKEGFTKDEFTAAMNGHVLGTAELKGIYRK